MCCSQPTHTHTQPTQRQLIKGLIDKVAASLRIREDVLGMRYFPHFTREREIRDIPPAWQKRHKTSIAKQPEARKLDDRIKQVLNCCSWQKTDEEGDEEAGEEAEDEQKMRAAS